MHTPEYRFIDTPEAANEALTRIAGEPEAAIDLEADSLHSYQEKICLIQISTAKEHIIVDPLACREALAPLEAFLLDRGKRKIFHGGDYDLRLFKKDFGFNVHNVFDTMIAAQLAGRPKFGLAALLEEHFEIPLEKKYQRADWSARPLKKELLDYAACDTAWLLPLRDIMVKDLERLGRLSWAEEEFQILEFVEMPPPKKPSALNVKGAGRLTPEQRGFLQRLLIIRDNAASIENRPAFKVFSSQVLFSWITEPPETRRDVVETKGASRRFLSQLAPEIVEALNKPLLAEEILMAPPSENKPLSGDQKNLLKRLKKARAALEETLGLPPGLMVNSATLEKITRMEMVDAISYIEKGLKKWQRTVAGEALANTLRGKSEKETEAVQPELFANTGS